MCSHQHKTLQNELRCNKVHTRLHFLFKCGCCELWEVLPVKKDGIFCNTLSQAPKVKSWKIKKTFPEHVI